MSDRAYRYALEVADSGSVAAAAANLYISSSAVSKAIAKLESDFGVPLFDRIGKSFIPTDAGSRFLKWAREIVSLEDALHGEMRGIVRQKVGLVRIGLQLTTGMPLIQAIKSFHQRYPQLEIHVIEDVSARLSWMLCEGELDFAIINSDSAVQEGLNISPIGECEIVFAVPRDHPLVKQAVWTGGRKYPVIQSSALADESFIIQPDSQRMGVFMEQVLASYGLPVRTTVRASSVRTILHMASEGLGVALIYDSTAKPYENSLNLTLLSPEIITKREVMLLTHPSRSLSPAVREFTQICETAFRY